MPTCLPVVVETSIDLGAVGDVICRGLARELEAIVVDDDSVEVVDVAS